MRLSDEIYLPYIVIMEDSNQMEVATERESKFHKEMCRKLSRTVNATVGIFPALEAVRPGCTSGIKALSALCLALERSKSLLHYCSESSILYLAITGESVVVKFEKVRACIEHNLRELEAIVSESLAYQVAGVRKDISEVKLFLDPSERELGREVLSLLTLEKGGAKPEVNTAFEQVARKLGLVSPRSILEEKKALRGLLEKAKKEEDTKKDSILTYFLYLVVHHSKSIKSYSSNSLQVGEARGSFHRRTDEGICLEKKVSSRLRDPMRYGGSNSAPLIPEEFRCPISLRVMLEPVVISSGQTYERGCIEAWFQNGHKTCPKTQCELPDLSITPNNCMKSLISNWHRVTGFPRLEESSSSPPFLSSMTSSLGSEDSLSGLSESKIVSNDILNLQIGNLESVEQATTETREVSTPRFAPFCEQAIIDDTPKLQMDNLESVKWATLDTQKVPTQLPPCERVIIGDCLSKLASFANDEWVSRVGAAKKIASLLMSSPKEVLSNIGEIAAEVLSALGVTHFEAFVGFLSEAIRSGCIESQSTAVSILLHLTNYDRGNSVSIVAAGSIPLLLDILRRAKSEGPGDRTRHEALATLRSLSLVGGSRVEVALCRAIPMLIRVLDDSDGKTQTLSDALSVLGNLAGGASESRKCVVRAGGVSRAVCHLSSFPEECLVLLSRLASTEEEGLSAIVGLSEHCIPAVVTLLEGGTTQEQEHAAALLLLLCSRSFLISQRTLDEGVVPGLVAASINGTERGKEKAKKLLQLFRNQRGHAETHPRRPNLSTAQDSYRAAIESRGIMKASSNPRSSRLSAVSVFAG